LCRCAKEGKHQQEEHEISHEILIALLYGAQNKKVSGKSFYRS
jgi:hypothetical protein